MHSFCLCPFHWKLRPSGVSLESSPLENILQAPANWAKVAQNHDARKAVSPTLSVLKKSGAIFRPRISRLSVRSFCLCPFHWKLRPSGVSLESAGLENILQVPENQGKASQNQDARKAVSATLSVLKWSGAIFRPRSPKPSVRSFCLCPFHWKARPSRVFLESPGLENIPQVPGNRERVSQNHGARRAVSDTLIVLKWSGAIFQPRSPKPSVHSFCLCPFHWKLRSSGVSLESPGLENISQVLANRAKVTQNEDAGRAVSAILSLLKWSGAIFRPRRSTPSVHSFCLCLFHLKLRPSGVTLESPGLENNPKIRQIESELLTIRMLVGRSRLFFQC